MTARLAPHAPLGTAVTTGEADLWCTYAAVRTAGWLGRTGELPGRAATIEYLGSRRNTDGGYAWSKGMASDAWATFYCTQAMAELGAEIPKLGSTRDWLRRTWSGDAYAMLPGQAPDVWATHFSVRTTVELCQDAPPDRDRLVSWLRALQAPDGGLGWSPEHAGATASDVRACFYGVMSWRALRALEPDLALPWDGPALVRWLRDQQQAEGGFRFGPSADTPCMWATYRATAALETLGAAPAGKQACLDWVIDRRSSDGAFVRWAGYDVADVWASFCAIGSLRAMGADTGPHADPVLRRLHALSCPSGGFTYREPDQAGDALSTAATALTAAPDDPRQEQWRAWLAGCRLPNEGGVMYMPARGSEVRCTLWALAAGAADADPTAPREIANWLTELQNPDGGFGYWEGRGSDLVSTAAAVETLRLLGIPVSEALDTARLAQFVFGCRDEEGHRHVPGAPPTLRAGLQALRIREQLGQTVSGELAALLERHRVPSGGFANVGSRMPDLLSTYEAVVTADRQGIFVDSARLTVFLDRLVRPEGIGWTPLAPAGGGVLADCLGSLLRERNEGNRADLPALTLS
ncbi:prenyltransferase/squalene oxidase repeat-containing protein [Amycolatopsis decaplanina]|uniref:Geranylgeranyl transferase type II subunit beta n=1 Tax=Amycolatopsis decaplanina DSM 44594 TaxID=1284240 RepID=M2XTM3_9PSEU|nr:prenyltransferase/squalene oxidase repeat-containing protein [Amycolatopsis decaplanina]EME52520.1 prenyltransferase/squalene oxidase [Amycolatopsis decaplanina DSM 44594]